MSLLPYPLTLIYLQTIVYLLLASIVGLQVLPQVAFHANELDFHISNTILSHDFRSHPSLSEAVTNCYEL